MFIERMDTSIKNLFFSGTSNVVLPVPNKQFYPAEFRDKSRLSYYSSLFNSVEINSSFYKVPQPATIKRWAESVSDGFRFSFKLWRDLTHNKTINFDPPSVHRFIDTISMVGDKHGCLLVQFPPSVGVDILGLDRLLSEISRADKDKIWKVAIEFRNRSWYKDEVYQLLDSHHMGIVQHDMPSSAPSFMDTDADFIYVRFHGPQGNYRGSYTDDFLSEYASYINDWKDSGKTVYCYFNNTMGEAVNNLIALNKYME